jgi:hypothetical protein
MWHTNISGSIEEIVLSFRNFQFGFSWVFGQSVSNQCVFNHVKCLGKANVADAALTEHLNAFVLFSTFFYSAVLGDKSCVLDSAPTLFVVTRVL